MHSPSSRDAKGYSPAFCPVDNGRRPHARWRFPVGAVAERQAQGQKAPVATIGSSPQANCCSARG